MNEDIQYWLHEVKSLQEQVATLQQEKNQAHRDALNWRQRYETEGQQRRQEVRHAQEELIRLRADLAQLQGRGSLETTDSDLTATQAEVLALTNVELLQQRLQEVLQERQQLLHALQTERKANNQTRESLTLALGDAVDQLTHYKNHPPAPQDPTRTQVSRGNPASSRPSP